MPACSQIRTHHLALHLVHPRPLGGLKVLNSPSITAIQNKCWNSYSESAIVLSAGRSSKSHSSFWTWISMLSLTVCTVSKHSQTHQVLELGLSGMQLLPRPPLRRLPRPGCPLQPPKSKSSLDRKPLTCKGQDLLLKQSSRRLPVTSQNQL